MKKCPCEECISRPICYNKQDYELLRCKDLSRYLTTNIEVRSSRKLINAYPRIRAKVASYCNRINVRPSKFNNLFDFIDCQIEYYKDKGK